MTKYKWQVDTHFVFDKDAGYKIFDRPLSEVIKYLQCFPGDCQLTASKDEPNESYITIQVIKEYVRPFNEL